MNPIQESTLCAPPDPGRAALRGCFVREPMSAPPPGVHTHA